MIQSMLKRGMAPVHPGEIIKEDCIEALGLSVTQAAKGLGVARSTLSKVLNGRAAVSPEMAVKLGEAFGTGPGIWIRLQAAYDLWHAEQTVSLEEVTRFHPKLSA